jgi:magnesium transporter
LRDVPVVRYFVHRDGRTEPVPGLDPGWLASDSGVFVWADFQQPGPDEGRVLRELFKLHQLAVEDALEQTNQPKLESYEQYLHLVLHGINFQPEAHQFDTYDVDFFLSSNVLITVHDGKRRSIAHVLDLCNRNGFVLGEGPVALMHRIVDTMVEHYRPEIEELEERLDEIEDRVVQSPAPSSTNEILTVKRDIMKLRRVVLPQRDVISRLARREFPLVTQEMAYRFRDVYDQLVRMTDDALMFQDRVTGILDAHLATVSNHLAQVSKLLAVIATLFGPLTVVTGLFGMNVPLPAFPGGEAVQFWWVLGLMVATSCGMFAWFRRAGWL